MSHPGQRRPPHSAARLFRGARTRRPPPAELGYACAVVGTSCTAIIEHAGGYIFDRRAAGWQVVVIAVDTREQHALAVLGVSRIEPADDPFPGTSKSRTPWSPVPALMAHPAVQTARLRITSATTDHVEIFQSTVEAPRSTCPPGVLLSLAAREYKRYALHRAGLPVHSITTADEVQPTHVVLNR